MGEVKRFTFFAYIDDEVAELDYHEEQDGAYVAYDDYATLEAENAKLRAELERRVPDTITMTDVMRAWEYAEDHPHKYLRGTTNWCAAVAHSLNQQRVAAPSAPKADAVCASLSADNQRITPPDPIIAKPHPLAEISKADDPVKVQLLEALEELMYARTDKAEALARAAIAAARKGEGE